MLDSPLFKPIFAGKNDLGTLFFFLLFWTFFHKKSEARIVRAGGREFEYKKRTALLIAPTPVVKLQAYILFNRVLCRIWDCAIVRCESASCMPDEAEHGLVQTPRCARVCWFDWNMGPDGVFGCTNGSNGILGLRVLSKTLRGRRCSSKTYFMSRRIIGILFVTSIDNFAQNCAITVFTQLVYCDTEKTESGSFRWISVKLSNQCVRIYALSKFVLDWMLCIKWICAHYANTALCPSPKKL